MQYIIRRKDNHTILRQWSKKGGDSHPTPKEMYPEFDPKSMEMGLSISGKIPEFFEINKEGIIQELPRPASFAIRTRLVNPGYKTVDGAVIPRTAEDLIADGTIRLRTPFEYIEDNRVQERSIKEVQESDALTEVKESEAYLAHINAKILEKISQEYRISQELKITKGYLAWSEEGKPEDDPREQAYREMEAFIAEIKAEYAPMKKYARKKLQTLRKEGSVKPSGSSSKAEIQEYLDAQGIEYNSKDTKSDLLDKLS